MLVEFGYFLFMSEEPSQFGSPLFYKALKLPVPGMKNVELVVGIRGGPVVVTPIQEDIVRRLLDLACGSNGWKTPLTPRPFVQ